MSTDIGGISVHLTADVNQFNAAIEEAKYKLAELKAEGEILAKGKREIKAEIEQTSKSLTEEGANLSRVKGQYGENSEIVRRIQASYNEWSKTLQRLNDDLISNGREQIKVRDEVRQVNAEIKNAEQAWKNAEKAVQDASSGLNNAETSLKNTGNAANSTASQTESLSQKLSSMVSTIKSWIVGSAGQTLYDALIGTNEQYDQHMARFDILMGQAEKAQAMMDNLNNFVYETPFDLNKLSSAAEHLMLFGTAEDEVMKRLKQLGDLSQGIPAKFDRIVQMYGRVDEKGRVTMMSLNSLVAAGVPIVQELADMYGVTREEVSQMASDGMFGMEHLNAAIERMTSEGGRFFGAMEKQGQTLTGMLATMSSLNEEMQREIGEATFEHLKSELGGLLEVIQQMRDDGSLGEMADNLGQQIAGAAKFIVDFIKLLYSVRTVVGSVVGAFVAWKSIDLILNGSVAVAQLWSNAVNIMSKETSTLITFKELLGIVTGKNIALKNIETGAITVHTAAQAKQILATEGATFAQMKLNAAIMANPIGMLVGVLTIAIGVVNGFKIATGEAVGLTNALSDSMRDLTRNTEAELVVKDRELDKTKELSQELEELGNKTDKTTDDKNRMKNIIDEINRVLPGAIELINTETMAYEVQSGSIDTLIAKKRALMQIESKKRLADAAMDENAKLEKDIEKIQIEQDNGVSMGAWWDPTGITALFDAVGEQGDLEDKQRTFAANEQIINDYYAALEESLSETVNDTYDVCSKCGRKHSGPCVPSLRPGDGSGKSGKSQAEKDAEKAAKEAEKAAKEAAKAAEKAAAEAAKAAEAARKKEFDDLKWRLDMGEIEEAEYYSSLEALRDKYFEEGSSEWQKHTLAIKNYQDKLRKAQQQDTLEALKWQLDMQELDAHDSKNNQRIYYNELARLRDEYFEEGSKEWKKYTLEIEKYKKQEHTDTIKDLENELSDYLSRSSTYINKSNEKGWLDGDTEVAAYNRTIEQIKALQQSYIDNTELTTEEIDALWINANNKLYDAEIGLSKALNKEFDAWWNDSKSYTSDREFFDDWDDWGDSEEQTIRRRMDKVKKALDDGKITWEEYYKYIAELDRELYTVFKNNVDKFYDGFMEVKRDEYDDKIAELKAAEDKLKDTWAVADRDTSLNDLHVKAQQFKGAVTLQGQNEFKRIQEEIKKLEREDELYRLEKENKELIDGWEAEYKKLEQNKDALLKDMLSTSKSVGADITNSIDGLKESFTKLELDGMVSSLTKYFDSVAKSYTQNNTNKVVNNSTSNTLTLNATVLDAVDAQIIGNAAAEKLMMG